MLVARCASVNGSRAAKVVRFAYVLQGDFLSRLASNDYFCVIPTVCHKRGFEGTDLATLAHLEYPQSATGILCKDFSSAMLKQA